MKGTKKITSLLLMGLMLAFSVNTFAQPGRGFKNKCDGQGHGMFKGRMHGFGGIERYTDELGLTDEQTDKLKTLRFEGAKEAVAKRSEVKIARIELRELMQADNPDEGAIKKQIEKIGKLKTDMMLAMVTKKLDVQKVLTDEQKAKLKELRKERGKNWKRGGRDGQRGFGFDNDEFDGDFFGGLDEDFDFAPGAEQEL